MATTINENAALVTLINVFTVVPENQQRLVEVLIRATEEVIKHQAGFISANIHKSLDGVRVVNYAQWRNRGDFEAMLKSPKAMPHLQEAAKLAQFDAHLYEVASVHHV